MERREQEICAQIVITGVNMFVSDTYNFFFVGFFLFLWANKIEGKKKENDRPVDFPARLSNEKRTRVTVCVCVWL